MQPLLVFVFSVDIRAAIWRFTVGRLHGVVVIIAETLCQRAYIKTIIIMEPRYPSGYLYRPRSGRW